MLSKAQQAAAAQAEAEEKLSRVEASRDALAREAAALATPAGLEGELRARFSVAKAGEEAVVIVEAPASRAAPAAAPGLMERFWAAISDFF